MGFIDIFLKKDSKDILAKDIELFVSRKIEESLNLEYKDIKAYENFDELSKDVSAFANSEGGLLILGIGQEKKGQKIFPTEMTWGDESLSKERLENNLTGKIHPRIEGLKIVPIRKNNSVIFLLDIPQSENPPHMAFDKRYYRRLNFGNSPMEHYEVSDFFGRRKKSCLNLTVEVTEVDVKDSTYELKIRLFLQNLGKAIAKYTQLTASFLNLEILGFDGSFQRIDNLREGVPSIQFIDLINVFHPTGGKARIGEITLRIKDSLEKAIIIYDMVAENMDLIKKDLTFDKVDLENAKTARKLGQRTFLTMENLRL
jgi:hypothetical protein